MDHDDEGIVDNKFQGDVNKHLKMKLSIKEKCKR